MAELKRCGEECRRQSGEWEQLPVSCSWIVCASYTKGATTKGDGGGLTEVSKCHWESALTTAIPCFLLIWNQRMAKGSEEGAGRFWRGDSSSPTLSNSSLQDVMDAGSSVQHRGNSQRKFHGGLLNTKPLSEKVLESQIAGDLRVFVRERAYAVFSWIHCCVWYRVLLGGWAGYSSSTTCGTWLSRLRRTSVTAKTSEKWTLKE